jgi:Mg2+-importing ATPase
LILSAALIVALAVALPYSPLARVLGFVPLPAAYFLFLITATLTYLVLVQLAKRLLLRYITAHRTRRGNATPSAA